MVGNLKESLQLLLDKLSIIMDSNSQIDDVSSHGSSSSEGGVRKAGGIILATESQLAIIRGRVSGKWGVPKGSLDDSDNSVLDGAIREIYEETGLKLRVENGKPLDYWMVYKCRLYLFNLNRVPRLKPQDTNEIIESMWLDLSDIEKVDEIYQQSTKMLKYVLRRLRRELNHS